MINPTISVVMPAYNVGPYIEEALRSILDQTFRDIEILVCDDGSTDNTWDVINSIQDQRIRKFRHEENQGYLKTYNSLIRAASGQFITFQDADDWSDLDRLHKQLEVFKNFPEVDLCACNGGFYYSANIQKKCPEFESGYITLDTNNFQFMLPSTMIRRRVLEHTKGFHEYFDRMTGGDQYFILDILARCKGYQLNTYSYFARFNPTSNHRTLNDPRKLTTPEAYYLLKRQRVLTGTDWLMEGKMDKLLQYEHSLMKNRRFMAEKYREYAAYRIDSNMMADAAKLLVQSLSKSLLLPATYRTIFYAFRKFFKLQK